MPRAGGEASPGPSCGESDFVVVANRLPIDMERLPDGSTQSVPVGTRPIDVAKSISPRLADAAIVARVNGDLYDLSRPLEMRPRRSGFHSGRYA